MDILVLFAGWFVNFTFWRFIFCFLFDILRWIGFKWVIRFTLWGIPLQLWFIYYLLFIFLFLLYAISIFRINLTTEHGTCIFRWIDISRVEMGQNIISIFRKMRWHIVWQIIITNSLLGLLSFTEIGFLDDLSGLKRERRKYGPTRIPILYLMKLFALKFLLLDRWFSDLVLFNLLIN